MNTSRYVGQRFNNFTVLEFSYATASGRIYYKCQCDCGEKRNVCAQDFTNPKKYKWKCFKCTRHDKHPGWKGCGEIGREYYSHVTREAKVRGLTVEVSIEFLWDLFLKQNRKCALTGLELTFAGNKSQTASLDRIDSKIGYTQDNVQWVYKAVNFFKSCVPNDLFILICHLVAKQCHSILGEDDLKRRYTELLRMQAALPTGAAHHRSKQFELISEQGEIIIVHGLKDYCAKNNLSIHSMKSTFKTGYFHRGWKIHKKLEKIND